MRPAKAVSRSAPAMVTKGAVVAGPGRRLTVVPVEGARVVGPAGTQVLQGVLVGICCVRVLVETQKTWRWKRKDIRA